MLSSNVRTSVALVAMLAMSMALRGSYIIGPTGPSPITPSLGIPKFIQGLSAATATTPASFSASFGALPAVGDIVVVFVLNNGDGSGNPITAVVTDNQGSGNGNGYTRLQTNPNNGSVAYEQMWCAPVVVSSGTFTVTATWNVNTIPGLMILEYSGTSCNMDRWNKATGGTSPYSCGSITTNNANDLVLSAIVAAQSTLTVTFTTPTGFTPRLSQTVALTGVVGAIADNIVSAVNTFTPTWGTGQNHSSTPCGLVALLSQ